jgi:hypothetical protein
MSKFSPSEFIKKLKNLMLDPVRFFEEAKRRKLDDRWFVRELS